MSNKLKLLREKHVRHRQTVGVQMDGEVRAQIEAVEDELDRLDSAPEADRRQNTKGPGARRKELETQLADLRASAEETTFVAVLEGMQRTAFRALVGQFPPRKGDDGKVLMADRFLGADAVAVAIPLIKACVIGYKESDDAAAETLPLDRSTLDEHGRVVEPGFVDWLLGHVKTGPDGEAQEVPPAATERQVDQLSAVALTLCLGDDAAPLPRRRSPQTTRAEG